MPPGWNRRYTRVFLDALLDEFVAFRNQIREQQRNKALTTLAEDVVRREKNLQVKLDKLVKSEQTGHIVIGNGPAMQSLQKLKEDRDAAAQLAAELALWLEDVKLGVEQREAKQTNRSSSSHDDLGAGLTLNEREYLGTQQLFDKLTFERTKLLKTTSPQNPSVVEVDEKLNDAIELLKFYEDRIRAQLKNQKAANERRLASLDGWIKVKEVEVVEQATKIATHEGLKKDYSDSKQAYDQILDLVRRFTVGEDMTSDHVTIMQRASVAVEDVSRGWFWKPAAKSATDK